MGRHIVRSASGVPLQFEFDGMACAPQVSTGVAVAGAATVNRGTGVVTSEALTTAAGANYTLTLTNSDITAASAVMASVAFGTSTTGDPGVLRITPANGSVVIIIRNHHASVALNGTIKIAYAVRS